MVINFFFHVATSFGAVLDMVTDRLAPVGEEVWLILL